MAFELLKRDDLFFDLPSFASPEDFYPLLRKEMWRNGFRKRWFYENDYFDVCDWWSSTYVGETYFCLDCMGKIYTGGKMKKETARKIKKIIKDVLRVMK